MKNQRGFILVFSMIMILILTLISLAMVNTSIFNIRLAGNDLLSKKAFFKAENGCQLWRGDLVDGTITDSNPSDPNWSLERIYENDTSAVGRHKVENGNVIILNGKPVYYVDGDGKEQESHKMTEIEFLFNPSIDPPAALYSHSNPRVSGSSVIIQGNDSCGSNMKPGILTIGTSVLQNGAPIIDGNPPVTTHSPDVRNIEQMADTLKNYANYNYDFGTSNGTLTGMDWGTLLGDGTPGNPVTPANQDPNIVYINVNDINTVTLTAGSHGSGVLIVKGNLDIHGGFSWYGIIIVTGSIIFTGGGERIITGGILAGQDADVDITLGGNINISYCSSVKDYLKKKIHPTRMISWREVTN